MIKKIFFILSSITLIITTLLGGLTASANDDFYTGDIVRYNRNNSFIYCRYQTRFQENCFTNYEGTLMARPIVGNSQFTNTNCGVNKYNTVQIRSNRSEFQGILNKFGYDVNTTRHYTVFGCSNNFVIINLNHSNPYSNDKEFLAVNPSYFRTSNQRAKCEWFKGNKPDYCYNRYFTTNSQQPTYRNTFYRFDRTNPSIRFVNVTR